MSSLDNMLTVLDLFGPATPLLQAEEIAARLGYSRTTAYRYLKTLCASGLLARFAGAYSLGPRAIELDYVIRLTDPLLRAAEPVMADLRDRYDCDVQLFGMSGDRIVVTHHVRGAEPVMISFGRGRASPLFLGAGGLAILAALPTARAKALFQRRDPDADWTPTRDRLKAIRKAGHAVSQGELDSGTAAVAAPILLAPPALPGALVLVFTRQRFALVDQAAVARVAGDGAARILAALRPA